MNNDVKIPKYKAQSLRPNPEAADASMGPLAYSVPPTLMEHFGDDEGASPGFKSGLPEGKARPGKRRQ